MEQASSKDKGIALLLFLVGVGMYASTLTFGFTFDDLIHVVHNPQIRSWTGVREAVTSPMFPGNLYRPLVVLSYVLTYQWAELAPFSYHLVNILCHGLVVVVLYFVVTKIATKNIASLTALLFAVHPIHTETVTNISGRAELFSAFFGLLSLWFFIRPKAKRSIPLSVVCLFFSMLSKESGIVFYPLALLVSLSLRTFSIKRSAYLLFSLLASLVLRYVALGSLLGESTIDGIDNPIAFLPLFERVLNALYHLFQYFSLILIPTNLSADYSFSHITPLQGATLPVVASFVGLLVLFLLTVVLLFYRRHEGIFLGWFFVSFAVTANIFFPIGTVFAERLAYVPSIGVLGFLASVLSLLERRALRIGLITMLTLVFAAKGILYQQFWQNNELLFTRQYSITPRSIKTKINYAEVLRSHGKYHQAHHILDEALQLAPHSADVLFALSLVEVDLGNSEGAKEYLQMTLKENPEHRPARNSLARLFLNTKEFELALREAEHILSLYPNDEKALITRFACALVFGKRELADHTLATLEKLHIQDRDFLRLKQMYENNREEDRP
ncbi:MAG: tetratricopeptide repeat protein [Bdellovibrionales bacterium]|nr:tetratricopeptide repeat protein [Bdellovibrionales bacterium]